MNRKESLQCEVCGCASDESVILGSHYIRNRWQRPLVTAAVEAVEAEEVPEGGHRL